MSSELKFKEKNSRKHIKEEMHTIKERKKARLRFMYTFDLKKQMLTLISII